MEVLPAEVWQLVFQAVVEAAGSQGALREATVCGSVCRRWREMTRAGLTGAIATLDLFPWHKRAGDVEVSRVVHHFPHLSGLVLTRCKGVTDTALTNIANSECRTALTRLEVLACGKVGSEAAMHQLLTQCTRLRHLAISNSPLIKKMGLVPPSAMEEEHSIRPLPLQVLRLTACENVNSTTIALIGQMCPDLRELDLTGCRKVMNDGLCRLVGLEDITPDPPTDPTASSSSSTLAPSVKVTNAVTPGCTRIEKLVLRGCFLLTPEGLLRAIPSINLHALDLSSIPNVTDEALQSLIPFLPSIKSLTIDGCTHVTDRGVAKLSRLKTLTSLDVRGLSYLSDMALPNLGLLSQLSSLSLKFCNRIEGSGFMNWTMGYMSLPLRVLDLQGLVNLTDNAIETLSTSYHITMLQELDLRACVLISNRAIVHLAGSATNLRTLRLEAQEEIDDDGISIISRDLTKLTTLDLEQMPSITEFSIEALRMPHLEILSVQSCLQLSFGCLRTIKDRCPRLTLLNLTRCSLISADETQELAQRIATVIPPASRYPPLVAEGRQKSE